MFRNEFATSLSVIWQKFPAVFIQQPTSQRFCQHSCQQMSTMSTLGLAIGSLNDLDQIIPAVRALGKRHAGYGVQYEHFAVVGEAFLWTFEQAFGPACTPDLKSAWTEAYLLLAGVMQEAMRELAVPA
jgi:nitric oxide dioxygenase